MEEQSPQSPVPDVEKFSTSDINQAVELELIPWKSSWQDRMKFILESGKHSDCEILIGVEMHAFQLHKIYMAMASPVLEIQLYGCKRPGQLHFPDVTIDSFVQLVRFIYVRELDVELFPYHDVENIIHTAKKFQVNDFYAAIMEHLRLHEWPLHSVYPIFTAAKLQNDEFLESLAHDRIILHKHVLLEDASLYMQTLDIFKEIIKKYARPCNELEVYQKVERYCSEQKLFEIIINDNVGADMAGFELQINNINLNEDLRNNNAAAAANLAAIANELQRFENNRRKEMVKELCQLIDFEKMTPHEFACGPVHSSLLSRKRSFDILLKICRNHNCDKKVFKFGSERSD